MLCCRVLCLFVVPVPYVDLYVSCVCVFVCVLCLLIVPVLFLLLYVRFDVGFYCSCFCAISCALFLFCSNPVLVFMFMCCVFCPFLGFGFSFVVCVLLCVPVLLLYLCVCLGCFHVLVFA